MALIAVMNRVELLLPGFDDFHFLASIIHPISAGAHCRILSARAVLLLPDGERREGSEIPQLLEIRIIRRFPRDTVLIYFQELIALAGIDEL